MSNAIETADCGLIPCACDYTARLRVGGDLDWLRDEALRWYLQIQPHHPACPCPKCFSARLGTWEVERV